ncbi:hypothetical protein IEQ44_01040 [Nocardioides sp. Y6]|uniref:Uncharacterized protein n=1 Tax=Nocardioides malaquae TaxID=2773426 RepID=A0ABR9RNU7_9ACTN|nr:hypothetical protein [Nocardioides malaquae]MBE7323236.1 hypothetical protein [Nocardioides malaquae]
MGLLGERAASSRGAGSTVVAGCTIRARVGPDAPGASRVLHGAPPVGHFLHLRSTHAPQRGDSAVMTAPNVPVTCTFAPPSSIGTPAAPVVARVARGWSPRKTTP